MNFQQAMNFQQDSVIIEALSLHTHIGCSEEERSFPQRLVLSLRIALSPRTLTQPARLEEGVCYAKSTTLIEALCAEQAWVLVEDLADAVCQKIFDAFPHATAIEVEVRKHAVPHTAWTGIRIARERPTG